MLDPVLVGAIAHLWFVTIHPFEDGNGRIARAIADMALARADNIPQRFYSLSSQIMAERKDYYRELEQAQRGELDIAPWLAWFLGCLDRAITRADEWVAGDRQEQRIDVVAGPRSIARAASGRVEERKRERRLRVPCVLRDRKAKLAAIDAKTPRQRLPKCDDHRSGLRFRRAGPVLAEAHLKLEDIGRGKATQRPVLLDRERLVVALAAPTLGLL